MKRYFTKEINEKGYIFDSEFSLSVPIATEKSIEIAEKQAEKFNNILNEVIDANKLKIIKRG